MTDRSDDAIRADWDERYTPNGHLSYKGARVLGDVPGLLARAVAAEARAEKAEAEVKWVNDHCGHMEHTCGCPNAPDIDQAWLASAKVIHSLRDEIEAHLANARRLADFGNRQQYERTITAAELAEARARAAELQKRIEDGVHRLRHTAGRAADYTAEGVAIRINADADFLAAASPPEDETVVGSVEDHLKPGQYVDAALVTAPVPPPEGQR